uniref:Pentatricopeptide repeat-containing protein n=1 Tax=Rhizophora mucronata TaxID=61149 RepID=A0A2P2P6Y2_RHIMU
MTFSTLMDGFGRHGHLDEAMRLFKVMQEIGVDPNVVVYNCLLNVMCYVDVLKMSRGLFCKLFSTQFLPNVRTCNIMMKGHCKEGLSNQVHDLFGKMED